MPINESKQTFIPKKSLSETNVPKRRSSSIFFIVALIIFLLSVVTAIGAYGYKTYLDKRVGNLSVSLERAKAAFEPALIQELKQLNTRLKSASDILSKHIAFSRLFGELEKLTLKSVRFDHFSYKMDEKNRILLELSGQATSYSSIALQSDIFGDSIYIKNPLFSNLGLNKKGDVTFDFSAELDPELVIYKVDNLTTQNQ